MPLDATMPQCVATPDSPISAGCYCNSPRSGWIVAVTHPQAEAWANANLNRRGYRTYLPMVLRHRPDRVTPTLLHNVLAPLWPGYLFVHHDSRDSWRPIYETPAVRSVLKTRDQIQWANAGAVEALEASEELRRSIEPPNASWASGTVLEVASGSFRGHRGALVRVTKDRAAILLMLFGVLRQVDVPLDNLAVASHAQGLPD